MMTRIAAAAALLICLSAANAQTAVYKWTDAEGQVHYSQTPPEGVDATLIELGAPPPSAGRPDERLQERIEGFEQRRQAREASQIEQAEKKTADKIRAENCRRARDHLAAIESHGQVSLREGDSYRRLTEEERQAEISQAQGHIKEFCGKTTDGK
ncbi:MAG: DUF4124 domain-containing protein [Gammaproteobacteria bacterium]